MGTPSFAAASLIVSSTSEITNNPSSVTSCTCPWKLRPLPVRVLTSVQPAGSFPGSLATCSATVDGLGLVGRISGVGERTSRVVLLTDVNSRVPVFVQPSGQRALLTGDNTTAPLLEFIEAPEKVRPGDRVVTSGDGGIFPSDLLVGATAAGPDGRLRVRLAADYRRLEFIRVLRQSPGEAIPGTGDLVGPLLTPRTAEGVGEALPQ